MSLTSAPEIVYAVYIILTITEFRNCLNYIYLRKEVMEKNKYAAGHLSAALTILIWGTTFISTKLLLQDFKPVEILFLRFVMGLLALILISPRHLKISDKKQEVIFACAGLCGITLYYLLENIALTYSMASNVGVIISVAPLFTGVLAWRFLKGEALTINFFIGFLTAIIGISLISFSGSTAFKVNPLGDLLALAAAALWAIYSILTKKISTYGYPTIQTTKRIFAYGLLFMLPALFLFDFKPDFTCFQDPVNLFNILFLGLGASALCFVTWNFAVKKLGAVKTSIYIYMVPVITVFTSVMILKEVITWPTAVGTILTMTGLFISKSKFRIRKTETVKY